MRENRTKKSKKRKKILFSVVAVLLAIIVGVALYVYFTVNSTLKDIHEPIEREVSEKRSEKIDLERKDPISVLLIGTDEITNEEDKGRTDSLNLITINPNTKSMKVMSIPRDTRTEMVGIGKEDKITAAHAYGGLDMTLDTVEEFLQVPIDYYVTLNMEGFKDIVDVVGGITVTNKFAFSNNGHYFAKGKINLNGEEALAFSRMRKNDPNPIGDVGRTDRHKQVIQAIAEKGVSIKSVTNFANILGAIGENVRTNLTFDEMLELQKNYTDARHSIETLKIEGEGEYINERFFYMVSTEEKERIAKELRQHLEIQ
ncbi:LCP family glycopolymer transferase [Bacillus nitroreducens]